MADRLSRARDPLLAVVAALGSVVDVVALDGVDTGERVGVLAVCLVIAGCLALRRRAPLATLAVAQACLAGIAPFGLDVTAELDVPYIGILFLNFSAAAHLSRRRWPIALGVATVGVLVSVALEEDPHAGFALVDVLWVTVMFLGLPFLAGRVMYNRAELQRSLHERDERAEREREARAQTAIAAERTRIAGDFHDVISAALHTMVAQARAAEAVVDRDAGRARAAFADVEDTGRAALGELREALGVLRASDHELALAPQPSLAHLPDLVRRARTGGLPVQLRVEGTMPSLAGALDLTAYRVVQEALVDARERHHAGHAEVLVRYEPDRVEIEVSDDGGAGSAGAPSGVRERVLLLGGDLWAGGRAEGGHALRARLPVDGSAS
jgi:signal transduction histidine kinase